ncbi:cytochrome c peroxidase [Chryseolinea lacunae]|uniref:Cytochrome-c peroxidase n=1 Tax=Chryseolinea lacunae TaxID=2801331 RepID=A0ABS1KNC0_9BACT|nr:cytochrome c peroxidase [Chryseolinea lacunae]MBL0740954.1 cytochrome-c peroxidase [Chryseolinea lacunae]
MKIRFTFVLSAMALIFVACTSTSREGAGDPLARVNRYWLGETDSLQRALDSLVAKAGRHSPAETMQASFYTARHHFKHIESLTLFYFPEEYARINGPALLRTEEYDDKIIAPTGFQVLEEKVFADSLNSAAVQHEARVLQVIVRNLQNTIRANTLSDANVFEAARIEMLTIMAMGISGFDSPVAFRSIPEAKSSLEGVEAIVSMYDDRLKNDSLKSHWHGSFQSAYDYLDKPVDFNAFNRAAFILDHMNRLSQALHTYQQTLSVANNTFLTALNHDKSTFFEPGAFNTDHFAPTYNRDLKPAVAALGRLLFFDPVLSGSNTRACASCHNPGQAFTDGKAKSVAFNFKGDVARNAPTLINAGFQKSQFWDQRVTFIEDQVNNVIVNPLEMHGHMEESARKLMESEAYRTLFKNAFGQDSITKPQIQSALASYIRSLTGLNARFDKYLRGDRSMLSQQEVDGFNVFMGKAKCGTCHFMPLFNGTVPPLYLETESEVLGVPAKADTMHATVDGDRGKQLTYNRDLHAHAFKTSTVRNAALTAPYMHNGVYVTLEDVIDFYNRGGGAGLGIDLGNQTLPRDRLQLTQKEKKQLVAFIQTLTDTTGLTARPTALPPFNNPKTDARKIGGVY